MEAKINIAEILKNKPQRTKLYDLLYNIDVELYTISTTDTETVVWCTNETDNNTTCHRGYSEFGTTRGCPDGLQILLPSKEMRDWAKFSWKKGDILVSKDNVYIIFEKFEDDTYTRFKGKHYLWKECNVEDYNKEETKMLTSVFEKATDDVAQTYINTIEEKLGGKLNRETLEVEKAQPEFKDGDILCTEDLLNGYIYIYKEPSRGIDICYCYKMTAGYLYICNLENRYDCVLPSNTIKENKTRFATDSEKQQLFDALAKEGKAWDSDKKQIVDLPKKCEFKPMDWCLMRDIRGEECYAWSLCQFAYQLESEKYEAVGGLRFEECIPYNEETAHLLGTTDEWEGGEQ